MQAREDEARALPANCNDAGADVLGHLHNDVTHAAAGSNDNNRRTSRHSSLAQALRSCESDDAYCARVLQVAGIRQLDHVGVLYDAQLSSAALAKACDIVPNSHFRDA